MYGRMYEVWHTLFKSTPKIAKLLYYYGGKECLHHDSANLQFKPTRASQVPRGGSPGSVWPFAEGVILQSRYLNYQLERPLLGYF